jgi:AraC family transcriptional regulator of adaptative response/methylated-DNA-[protein]-cysteine methyltransferase
MFPSPAAAAPTDLEAGADDARWAAVATRDATHDGRFVYAVRTTGIFCRPGCPSRRPERAHVVFLADAESARTAGFRPCRRCRPDDPARWTPDAVRAVARARAWLDAHPERRVTLDELAAAVGSSPHHLQRSFTRIVGVSPRRYHAALRAERLKGALRSGTTVSAATYAAGYEAVSRVYAAADAHLGMTPAAYRDGGRGVHVRHVTAPSPVGVVLVAVSPRGLCAVTLGDDADTLARALAAEFPAATREAVALDALTADDPLARWLAAVRAALDGASAEGAGSVTGGALDVPGTPLQHRVWEALRAIPTGETRTYTELAAAVGAPRAVRAVASACARNRLAVVVPCHRVVRSDGSTGEYRWGAERKRALLRREATVASGDGAT